MTITLITGANKGIGFATAEHLTSLGHTVYIGARDAERGREAAASIGARSVHLDVTDDRSVAAALAEIDASEGHLDVVVNNAGIQEIGMDGPTALRAFDTNAVGIVRVMEAALPLLRKAANPNVVTISSSAGSFWAVTNPDRVESQLTNALYAASKAAATMLTLQYAKANPDIIFTALEPGYTDTDMTAAFEGGRSPRDSALVVARFATLDPGAPSGTFQDEDGRLPW
ncbi:SDR family NAD(P)-dependent oxidoreductase [Herbiconiux ginsengi]|uniref:NADP-dependent 3-hydroxy acid dehydrogenase YdfG n=1 Tax=Herbiconiux ginsengi TaxID=381665 RepID=A0A1H3LKL9_9MICO|nr:SDR family NAD(P)-dependent oxidoreductase [Herbiconiux ginsengi]SDY64395.1 NADP-dependent 3-hydroxy acid dehydrogenase YdfG [Herbiconiux ginsengi]